MKIMAIGGHAGDMDLTAGAVLAQAVLEGHEAVLFHLTPGEKGHPTLSAQDYAKQKIAEAQAFAEIIGARVRFLDYGDGELPVNDMVKFQVADVIRQEKPQIVITHWKNSIHKDHANTHLIVEDAIFYAEIKHFVREHPPHSVQSLYYADNWEDPFGFDPDLFVNIRDDAYEKWLKAAQQYAYARGETGFQYLDYYRALFVVRGLPHGCPRAEAFARPAWSRQTRLASITERG
ncbi:MAG: LmbE family protein [Sulfobacillus acidophilus]|uniref:LmbE family protein n=1 Tax=Sulfobacillus acidophilus TaxID=53633 RepID=A0A2T2WJX3_9FIRM|nr:MAG: LmbE family protein [Sulfobacillus acidophilus]